MINFIKKHKVVFAVFGIALVFRLLVFGFLMSNYGSGSFYFDNDGRSLNGNDAQHYVLIARNLVEEKSYSRFVDPPFQPTSNRTPLLPLYFVPFIYLFGFGSIWLAILILDIILSLTPVAAYYLAKLFVSNRKSLVVALLVAVEPLLVYRSNIAEPDALLVLFFLISIYCLILFWRNGGNKKLCLSAVFLGLLTLLKPVGFYLMILFVLFISSRMLFNRREFKRTAVQAVFFILVVMVIIFPWLWRNHSVFGVWGLSSIKGHNLYSYYTRQIKLDNEEISFDANDRDPVRNIKYQKQLVGISLERIKNNPKEYFKNHFLGTGRSLLANDFQSFYYNGHQKILPFAYIPVHDINLTQNILDGNYENVLKFVFSFENFGFLLGCLLLALFYLVVVYSWARSFRINKKTFVVFTFFLVLTFYFVSTPGLFVDPKYRLPAIPLMLIMFFHIFRTLEGRKRRKIVIATGTFSPEISGQSTFISSFIKRLPKPVRLISYGPKNEQRENNIFIVKRNIWRHFRYWRLLREKTDDFDIIYAQDLVSSGLPAALAKRKSNRLFVRIGGDFLWEKMVNSGRCRVPLGRYYSQPKSFVEKIYLAVYRFVLGRCDRVIFNTRWQADMYKKVFAIPDHRISVIGNPFLGGKTREIGNESNEIIFAGRFIPLKNLKRLIEAFKAVEVDRKLVLIGDGPQKEELVKLAGGDRRIEIEDGIGHRELLDRISRCDMVVVPSLSEISPNVVLEAIGFGKKVVLTKENGLSEEVKNYCELVDPLSVESIKLGIEKSLVGERKSVPNLVGWRDVIDRTLDLFDELNIVNIGTDKTLVGGPKLGDAVERHREYGRFVNHLDIIVYTNRREGLGKFKISDNVVGHPSNSFAKMFFYRRARKIFKEINGNHKVDIIVCQDPFLPALIGWRLKRKYGCKMQVNFHGDFWRNTGWLKERWLNIIFLSISKFTVPRADAIRVVSRGQKEKLIEAGIGRNRIEVIPTPVEVKRFRDYDNRVLIDRLRRRAEGKKMVLMVGRKDKVKDFNTLFKTMNLVYRENRDVGLWLVGNYSEAEGLPLSKGMKVITEGEVDTGVLPAYYHVCCLVVSSSISESFGKVLVEANACGKPVVATATTGSKEIVTDGENGFLAPVGNAEALTKKILYLLNNPEEAGKMGEAGKRMAEKRFDRDKIIQKIIRLWKKLSGL